MASLGLDTSEQQAFSDATVLAVEGTRLAYDRTMLAWVRTSAALITFGFSVFKFFQFEHKPEVYSLVGPRGFGLIMIGVGLVSLLLASIQTRQSLERLRAKHGPIPPVAANVLAFLIAVVGILAFCVVLVNG